MIEKSKGGRPRKYTEAQVLKGIASVEARGDIADGATVKQAMRDELGVSPGIDAGILDAEVRRICQERDEAKAKRLAEMLPSAAKAAAAGIGDEVARAMTAALAIQFDELSRESRAREAELDADLRMFRQRIQELEADLASKETSAAEMEEDIAEMSKQEVAKDALIADLNAQIDQQSRDDDLEARLITFMKQMIANEAMKEIGENADSV
ncbi:hypothetical protein [Pikeienuella sp. HZG-20]|uniref:hypothetical protein n=1 Tax=Paludibacillus litoralis TaxID=3133267 RepID=UPI0030EBA0D8